MKCIICGISIESIDGREEYISSLKAKEPKIVEQIDHVFSSNPKKAIKLIKKLKKYVKDIESYIKYSSHILYLCDDCKEKVNILLKEGYNELIYSRLIDILNEYKEYSSKANEAKAKLFKIVSTNLPEQNISNDFYDADNDPRYAVVEDFNDATDNIRNGYYSEYYETKLLIISGFYNNEILLRLQKLLDEFEKEKYIAESQIKIHAITEEEFENILLEIGFIQENIQKDIEEIKKKISQE